ncbi:MAG TPA: hypothetical protein VLI55_16595 [Bryobacteraceae bacterium]|nr:hypothetical protein [Bryobacteraceae bacterium]
MQQKQSQSSGSYDLAETDYDALGRPSPVTVPYTGTQLQLRRPRAADLGEESGGQRNRQYVYLRRRCHLRHVERRLGKTGGPGWERDLLRV